MKVRSGAVCAAAAAGYQMGRTVRCCRCRYRWRAASMAAEHSAQVWSGPLCPKKTPKKQNPLLLIAGKHFIHFSAKEMSRHSP